MPKYGAATKCKNNRFLAERNSVGAIELIAIDCVPESMQASARINGLRSCPWTTPSKQYVTT